MGLWGCAAVGVWSCVAVGLRGCEGVRMSGVGGVGCVEVWVGWAGVVRDTGSAAGIGIGIGT